jgi:ribosomal protein S18 acetylase RimI-like enzyme
MKIAVRTPEAHEFAAAARLLFGRLPESEKHERTHELLASMVSGEVSPDGILLAEIDGEPAGAILSALQPDKTAFVWPPEVRESPHSSAVSDALLQELARRLDAQQAWLGQCILGIDDAHDRAVLARNGFPHLTDLHYLEKVLDDDFGADLAVALQSEAYDPARNHDRFVRMLERTYVQTFDCPEISGARTPEEALQSHKLSGEFHPSRWKLYHVEDQDVGVLLMNDHPDQDAWEITYLGVAKEHRGRGYGRAMIARACREARASNRRSVLVAVDCRNRFAKTIYEAEGFEEFATRAVHVRVCTERVVVR